MTKICIIGVYFGKFPNYFNLWLKSAGSNSTINFLIITDQKLTEVPCNVEIISMTLQEMQRLASQKLGFEIKLERPYKCCDLRPAYGLIFRDYIKGYDYWGHCDFDLIWGDIRKFVEKYNMEDFVKFLPLGHLSLFRNSDEGNRLFYLSGEECPDYRSVFTSGKNHWFDEIDGIGRICECNNVRFFKERIFADISEIYERFCLAAPDINYDRQIFLWDDGKVKRVCYSAEGVKEEEYIYIHFKRRHNMAEHDNCSCRNSFFITPTGFYACNGRVTLNDIEAYNHFISTGYEEGELERYKRKKTREEIKTRIKNKILSVLNKCM